MRGAGWGDLIFTCLGLRLVRKILARAILATPLLPPPHLPRGERGCGPLEPDTVCVHLPPPRAGPLSGRTWQPQGWEGTRGLTLAEPLAGIQHQVLLGDLQLLHQPLVLGPHLGDSLLAMLQNFQFRVEACDLLEGR